MPQVIKEYDWILHSILVVGPTRQSLKSFFEDMAFELTTQMGGGQDLGLRSFAVSEPGPLAFWLSTSLGKRGSGTSRLSLIGVSLDGDFKEVERLFPLVDGGILLAKEDHANFEKILKKRNAAQYLGKRPWVYFNNGAQEKSLRLKALKTWVSDKVDRVLWEPRLEHALEDSLSWILEESP